MEKINLPNDEFFRTVKERIDEGRSVAIKPKGNSMVPVIRSGRDTVVLSPVTGELKTGDILLFVVGGKHVLHRLVSIDGDRLTMMGDGNSRGMECCLRSDVVAIVTKIIREGKSIGHAPGRACVWRLLRPVRRYILAIYRRLIPSDFAAL